MVITEIRSDKTNKKMYIYADGRYLMSIDIDTYIKSGLKIGNIIDESEISEICKKKNLYGAKEKALRLLSRRAHSKKELLEKVGRTYNDSAAAAVDKMEEIGLINDTGFAEMYAGEMFNRKHFSIKRAEYELYMKGIDKETINKTIEQISPNEEQQIIFLLNGKYKGKFKDEKGFRRTVSALQRLGYSWDQIKKCISMLQEN